jgi:hypothetical protein
MIGSPYPGYLGVVGWTGASRILNLKNDADYRRFAGVWSNGKFEIFAGFTQDHH